MFLKGSFKMNEKPRKLKCHVTSEIHYVTNVSHQNRTEKDTKTGGDISGLCTSTIFDLLCSLYVHALSNHIL
jgi:hypothetical protein